ncbi:uncharacterized protein TNCV_1804981 [Trichonephila clavipes]|nr:uncharacterized protein TNCV_1804981 [Trichonephila clavipes]
MVWGCMSSHGVGRFHIVSGTVKAMGYIEILQNKLLPTARDLLGNQSWIFQDDNAPYHRAKKAKKTSMTTTGRRLLTVESIRGFQECDEEDVETWMACDAEDCGFQMLNDDEIVISLQEESDPVDDETNEDEDNNNN